MSWHSAGTITVVAPGTRVQIVNSRQGCQSILFQALSNASHTNTGRVYIFESQVGNRLATIAPPTTNTIPSASATIPNAPSALNLQDYWIDADNSGDGVDVSYLR